MSATLLLDSVTVTLAHDWVLLPSTCLVQGSRAFSVTNTDGHAVWIGPQIMGRFPYGGTLSGNAEDYVRILGGQVRAGRPAPLRGLPDSATGPAFATAAGLLGWVAGEGRTLHDIDLDEERQGGFLRRIFDLIRRRL